MTRGRVGADPKVIKAAVEYGRALWEEGATFEMIAEYINASPIKHPHGHPWHPTELSKFFNLAGMRRRAHTPMTDLAKRKPQGKDQSDPDAISLHDFGEILTSNMPDATKRLLLRRLGVKDIK